MSHKPAWVVSSFKQSLLKILKIHVYRRDDENVPQRLCNGIFLFFFLFYQAHMFYVFNLFSFYFSLCFIECNKKNYEKTNIFRDLVIK